LIESVALGVAAFAALAAISAGVLVLRGNKDPLTTKAVPEDLSELIWNLGKQEQRISELYLAVDEGIRRVDRAEARVKKTVTSARRLVAESGLEHPGIEAEHEELLGADEPRSEPEPVLELRGDVEDDSPSGYPGVTKGDLKRLRDAREEMRNAV